METRVIPKPVNIFAPAPLWQIGCIWAEQLSLPSEDELPAAVFPDPPCLPPGEDASFTGGQSTEEQYFTRRGRAVNLPNRLNLLLGAGVVKTPERSDALVTCHSNLELLVIVLT